MLWRLESVKHNAWKATARHDRNWITVCNHAVYFVKYLLNIIAICGILNYTLLKEMREWTMNNKKQSTMVTLLEIVASILIAVFLLKIVGWVLGLMLGLILKIIIIVVMLAILGLIVSPVAYLVYRKLFKND